MKLVATLLTGALVVGGFGVGAYVKAANQPSEQKMNTTAKIISVEKAKEIALNVSHGGKITKIDLDQDDGRKEYEVEIINQDTEYDVDIDALTGKVVNVDRDVRDKDDLDDDDFDDDDFDDDNFDDDDKYELNNVSPTISLEAATKIALTKVKGTISESDLDTDNNRLVYDFEIITDNAHEAEVKVDATNGKVLKVEIDD